jgi:NodT family efflux transporter outer membrane factor (OMF) lipoprotein
MIMKTMYPVGSLRATALSLALFLAGCTSLHTPYQRPALAVPAAWAQQAAVEPVRTEHWWRQFNDPQLDAVVQAALARNSNLAVAALTLRQAQLQADLTGTAQTPTVGASVAAQQQRSLGGAAVTTHSTSATFNTSYEVDLWGRLSSLTDAARWQAQASAEDREAAEQSLVGTTAELYWQLGYINQRIASAGQSVAYATDTLRLVEVQHRHGAVSALEVEEAQRNVSSQRATLSSLQQSRVEYRNALAIVFDAAPGAATLAGVLTQEPQQLPTMDLPHVGADVPASLLGRRPDLRAAEMRLRAVLADADATRASYYPTLSLTGALGGASTTLGNVLAHPYALLGQGLTLPFLQVNRMKLDNAIAATGYESAVISFRQTLYSALADVDNALSARATLAQQATELAASLAAAQRVERLYQVRYRNGAVALSIWLTAQETRRTAEIAMAENQLARLRNLSLLYRTLGGGTGQAIL